MVSTMSLLGMVFSLLISVGVPVTLLIVLRCKTGKGLFAALVGAGCFLLFALVLEQLLHSVVIPLVLHNPLLYCVYGCLAAGVFEETGRLVGLSFLCKWRRKKDSSLATGLGYGIGHGGFEAAVIVGIATINNLVFAVMINTGNTSTLLANAGTQAAQVQQAITQMQSLPSAMFWVSGLERISAIALHMALSLLIWMVVTKRVSRLWYGAAILLHALTNTPAALYQTGMLQSIAATEILVACIAGGTCVLVWVLLRRTAKNQPDKEANPNENAPETCL